MMRSDLQWFVVPRPAIPGVLVGVERPERAVPFPQDAAGEDFLVACRQGAGQREFVPVLVVVPSNAANHLSWLASYSPETFPISQYARVLSGEDFFSSQAFFEKDKAFAVNTVWPSIVVGEILGQGDSDADLGLLPLSRAQSCFSYTMGRAHLLYGEHLPLIGACATRLAQIASDNSFVSRSIKVEELGPVWALAPTERDDKISPVQHVMAVASALTKDGGEVNTKSREYARTLFADLPYERLGSGPVEQRVRVFERFAALISARSDGDPTGGIIVSLSLASGAFLVGNGSSHLNLLAGFLRRYPMVYPWFGLLVGLSGPRTWESVWLTTVKGVERQLRMEIGLYGPPSFDLCWVEYKWMRDLARTEGHLKNLRKLLPRALSVEVVPGAPCQFRLSQNGDVEAEGSKSVARGRTQIDSTSRAVEIAVARLDEATAQLKKLLGEPKQRSLFENRGTSRGRDRRPGPTGKNEPEDD